MLFSKLIFTIGVNQSVKVLRCCLLESRGNVAIGVKSHLNSGVPEPLLDYFTVIIELYFQVSRLDLKLKFEKLLCGLSIC